MYLKTLIYIVLYLILLKLFDKLHIVFKPYTYLVSGIVQMATAIFY